MSVIIVGGKPGVKESSIISKISDRFKKFSGMSVSIYNGLVPTSVSDYKLILWMPDIDNEKAKDYPVKDKGSVLICSKVMREGYTRMDAISRIFKMHGNAVIAIYKDNSGLFKFELIDALGNIWCVTRVVEELCSAIFNMYHWTRTSVRKSIERSYNIEFPKFSVEMRKELNIFVDINKELSYKVADQCGNRYFGNYSTRCTKLFPSLRKGTAMLVSPRNVDKKHITIDDMVLIHDGKYIGEKKPSVDTPVQLQLYEDIDSVNFMIHGHAYIDGDCPTTSMYYPCGDTRETDEVSHLMVKGHRAINLLNHGFLISARTIEDLAELVASIKFRKMQSF